MMRFPSSRLLALSVASGLATFVLPGFARATIVGADEFARLDANRDGVVSSAENAAQTQAIFRQVDTNRDDVLTVMELAIAEERRADSKARGGARQSVSAGLRNAAEQIKAIDENGDGEATSAEMVAGAQQRFALMDVNRDGYLDPTECEAGTAS